MGWRRAGRRDLDRLMEFLLREEWRTVPLTSRLIAPHGVAACGDSAPRPAAALPPWTRGRLLLHESPRGVDGALLLTSGGLLVPALGRGGDDSLPGLQRHLAGLHSVMGVARDVRRVEEGLACLPAHAVDYHLFTLERDTPPGRPAAAAPSSPLPGLVIRQAGPDDLDSLFPLQQGYELEEVVLNPRMYSREDSRRHLRLCLRQQLVLMAEHDGVPVAKAGTNARGFGVAQVGGVYTRPDWRNRAVGGRVMEALLERLFALYPGVCLFVKRTNAPAIALYRRLGFSHRDEFRISYYGL